jgi:hypothetical protein
MDALSWLAQNLPGRDRNPKELICSAMGGKRSAMERTSAGEFVAVMLEIGDSVGISMINRLIAALRRHLELVVQIERRPRLCVVVRAHAHTTAGARSAGGSSAVHGSGGCCPDHCCCARGSQVDPFATCGARVGGSEA